VCGSTTSTTCRSIALSKHEVVFSGRRQKREHGVTTLDIAKAILDHGIHPPTIYFPLIVEEALMVEPTETESLETLDAFVDVMRDIAEQAIADPEALKRAPTTTPVGRLDEARPRGGPTSATDSGTRWVSPPIRGRSTRRPLREHRRPERRAPGNRRRR
jgi:glycine cleavage system protein P-like pyridoxal-binding family